jgi:hypothetical protein
VEGGTPVTVVGTLFNSDALVEFVERDVAGVPTGDRSECVWRTVPGLACNDTHVTCLAPPRWGAGRYFDVVLSVAGVPAAFNGFRFEYDAPEVRGVAPSRLAPHPGPGDANLTVTGTNFGFVPGTVTVGRRRLACPIWTNTALVCAPVVGVVARGAVVVTAASTQASLPTAPTARVAFEPPGILGVYVAPGASGAPDPAAPSNAPTAPGAAAAGVDRAVSGTRGGVVLRVNGSHLASPSLPVSLWLSRGGLPASGSPWAFRDVVGTLVRCPLVEDEEPSSTWVACTVPVGTGAGWRLVVVNHDLDVDGGPKSSTLWQVGG